LDDVSLDYVHHLAAESGRFARVLQGVPAGTRVPTCPDWDVEDLLWHLGHWQWRWAAVVREGLTGADFETATPARPPSRAGLEEFFTAASGELAEALAVAPQTPAWTWNPNDQTAGFIARRQAQEVLIHRVDAELTAGERTPLDPALSADGVDEALRIMYGGLPPWGRFDPDPQCGALRVRATDTADSWLVRLGGFAGTDPDDGEVYAGEPDTHPDDVDSGGPAAATIEGRAADLDCWLWHRPEVEPVRLSGDPAVLQRFQETIAPGVN
jgi:uncharacterized protein (TIGR03083 family)